MEKKNMIAVEMSKAIGFRIKPELVVQIPWDETPGYALNFFNAYAARYGEKIIIALQSDDGVNIHII